ncbi:MAG: tetratricopeptide repeat protein, partial [bacterium]
MVPRSFRDEVVTGWRTFLGAPIHLGRWRLPFGRTIAVCYTLLALGLGFSRSPLLGVVSVETSALLALCAALVFPWNLAHRCHDLKAPLAEGPLETEHWPVRADGQALGWLLAMSVLTTWPALVLRLLALLRNSLPVVSMLQLIPQDCDPATGNRWFLAIPLVTCVLVLGMTGLIATLTRNGKAAAWWTCAWVWGSLLLLGANWLLGPRVAFFHPILGSVFLPNYNPVVVQNQPFWIGRALAFHWGIAGWLIFVLAWDSSRARQHSLRAILANPNAGWRLARQGHLLLIIVVVIGTWFARGPLGIATPYAYLRHELPGVKVTEHFRIHYDPDSPTAAQIDDLALLHEFHYAHIATVFALTQPQVIEIYLYPTPDDKERLTGARGSVFAKPWIKTAHVFATGTDVSALRHELTHILGYEFGPWPSHVNLCGGVAEGIAEAVSWDAGPTLTFDQWAEGGQQLKLASSLPWTISNEGFFTGRIPLNYATCGSFMRWLLDTQGVEKFRTFFHDFNPFLPGHDAEWSRVYGATLPELETEWRNSIKGTVTARDLAVVQYSYEQPAYINQRCAHEVAVTTARAQIAYANQAWQTAVDAYDDLIDYQPDNPNFRIGKLVVLSDAKRFDEALEVATALQKTGGLNQGLTVQLWGEIADVYLKKGDWDKAREALNEELKVVVFPSLERDARINLAVLDLPVDARTALIA